MIPPMNFSILTPLAPRSWVPHFSLGGGGGLRIVATVCRLDLGPEELFSCTWPEPVSAVLGPDSTDPRLAPSPHGPLLVRSWPLSRWLGC